MKLSDVFEFLKNQSAIIQWNNKQGGPKDINQRGILSPLLFNYYINDIIKGTSKMEYSCKFGLDRINLITYADDMVLLGHLKQSLNTLYKTFKDLINKSKLLINEEKLQILGFKNGKTEHKLRNLALD